MKNLSSITSLILIAFVIVRDYREVLGDNIAFLLIWVFIAVANDIIQGLRKNVVYITMPAQNSAVGEGKVD